MRTLYLRFFFSVGLLTAAISGVENKKCRDVRLVELVTENCNIMRAMGAFKDDTCQFTTLLDACAQDGVTPEVLAHLRTPMEQTNRELKGGRKTAREHLSASERQVRRDYATLKSLCSHRHLNAAIDEYVKYTNAFDLAINYLQTCRDNGNNASFLESIALQIRAELRTARFKNEKPPDLQAYIDAHDDADVRRAAQTTLAELTALKRGTDDKILIAGSYTALEQVLFNLDRHTHTENLEALASLKKKFAHVRETLATKKKMEAK